MNSTGYRDRDTHIHTYILKSLIKQKVRIQSLFLNTNNMIFIWDLQTFRRRKHFSTKWCRIIQWLIIVSRPENGLIRQYDILTMKPIQIDGIKNMTHALLYY